MFDYLYFYYQNFNIQMLHCLGATVA